MATRKKKADKPLLWNPDKVTPFITPTGIAIGCAYNPPARTDLSPEELWIQNLLLPQGLAVIPRFNVIEKLMTYAGIALLALSCYLFRR